MLRNKFNNYTNLRSDVVSWGTIPLFLTAHREFNLLWIVFLTAALILMLLYSRFIAVNASSKFQE